MANNPECARGGISITWKIENFRSIQNVWGTLFPLEWPKTKSKWHVRIIFLLQEANRKRISLTIKKFDDVAPFSLIGNTFVLNEDNCLELNRFDRHDFLQNQNKIHIFLTPLEGNDFEKQDLINNNCLTFRINLWDPNINDLVAVEYFIRSTYIQQMCSFRWELKGDRDWKTNGKYTESSTDVPMKFTDFLSMQTFSVNFNLQIKDRDTFAIISVVGQESNSFLIQIRCKLKIQRNGATDLPFLDTGWSGWNQFTNLSKISREITNKVWHHSSTEWVIKIKIIVVTNYRGLIENIFYEPDTQNLPRKPIMAKKKDFLYPNMQQCMHKLYKEGEFCDVVISANGETLSCHKAVLCARSSVFKTMFENDMLEKETNIINIEDADPGILRTFLTYLYSDNLEDEDFDSVVKLYKIAHKYAVHHLQNKCADILTSCLSTDNVCELLDLADIYQDQDLKEEILSFIYDHAKEIVNSPPWKMLLACKPLLAAETYQAVFTRMLS